MVNQTTAEDFPVSSREETAIVHLPHRVTVMEAVAFKQTVIKLLEKNPPWQQIILDFRQTTFIDSSGVGALVHNLKAAKRLDVFLGLQNVQPQVKGVLSLTGLERALTILPDAPNVNPIENKEEEKRLGEQTPPLPPLPTTHPSVRSVAKRGLDIVGAIVGLGITAVLFPAIAIAIKLDSPGPIFFSQIRCGWMGRSFRMWKFRSMCINAEAMKSQVENQITGPLFKNENDPRVTRVGRFLRRRSLDELPQFWNVLTGEMSLVGTRPVLPDELDKYEVPEWQRLDVKPGMTGEWQVNGRSNVRNFEDVIRLDLKYQQNWSFLYDLKLIVKTISILFQKNTGAF
ncbi:anti-sigma factor antagonist [[Phormidium] sp. ETS-05]|uniref:anti-sigma factor antagonist n=1 Tax=[Phormidium] sp. ETS-05 TaxID=222819 RepID=UPI0018EED81A|nr:anti-sigma factor antagonist [[Phormidium] sp. ETS-05]